VFLHRTKPGQSLHSKKRRLLKGTVVKVMSSSIQAQYITQRLTIRRDDVRVPKCTAVHQSTETSPVGAFCRLKRCLSGSSSLNLQQLEQQEEQEELDLLSRTTKNCLVLLDQAHVCTRPTFSDCCVRRREESDGEVKIGLKLLPVTESCGEISRTPCDVEKPRNLRTRGKLSLALPTICNF
jgi:hypothetical protein